MLELVAGFRHNRRLLSPHNKHRVLCQSNIDIRRPEQWPGPRRGAISANSDDTLRLELGIASSKVRSFR